MAPPGRAVHMVVTDERAVPLGGRRHGGRLHHRAPFFLSRQMLWGSDPQWSRIRQPRIIYGN